MKYFRLSAKKRPFPCVSFHTTPQWTKKHYYQVWKGLGKRRKWVWPKDWQVCRVYSFSWSYCSSKGSTAYSGGFLDGTLTVKLGVRDLANPSQNTSENLVIKMKPILDLTIWPLSWYMKIIYLDIYCMVAKIKFFMNKGGSDIFTSQVCFLKISNDMYIVYSLLNCVWSI